MTRLEIVTRGACLAVTSVGLWLVSVAMIIAGGYLIVIGTPCLCFDANGWLLFGGLAVILVGAAMMLWAGDIAKLVSDRLAKRFFQRMRRTSYAIYHDPTDRC